MTSSIPKSGQAEASFVSRVVCADVASTVGSGRAKGLHNHYSYEPAIPFIEYLLYARYWYEQATMASNLNITTQDVLGRL